MVLGGDHRVRAGTVSHPQASAQVVRISHPIENQNQWVHALLDRQRKLRRLQTFQQFVKRMHLGQDLDAGYHALVTMATAEFGQAHAVGFDQPDAGFLHFVEKLAHARIAACGFEINFDDGTRSGFQADAHGVKAEQYLG